MIPHLSFVNVNRTRRPKVDIGRMSVQSRHIDVCAVRVAFDLRTLTEIKIAAIRRDLTG